MFHRLVLTCALLLAAPAWAATFIVDSPDDYADATPGDGICAAAGGVCTLRAAIQEANALPGPDTIHFNLPSGGPRTIYPQTGLPDITETLTIDGTLQPGNQSNTLAQGTNAVLLVGISGGDAGWAGLVFKPGSSHSTVRSLRITHFTGGQGGIVIDGDNPGTPLEDIRIHGNFIGTYGSNDPNDVNGSLANYPHGIYVTGNVRNVQIGDGTPASRNLIVGRDPGSAVTAAFGANDVRVYDNLIGTNPAGTQRVGTQVGVLVEEGARTVDVLGNTIGASHTGVLIRHGGTDPQGDANRIQGNRIGIGPSGENIAGNEDGIHITNAARPTMPFNNTIGGGTAQSDGNTIAHWGRNGVRVSRTNNPSGNMPLNVILGNRIFGNGALGIELIDQTSNPPLGANPQDPPPPAINGGQAAPYMTSALIGGGGVQVGYHFSGPPGQAYYIEVFSNTACDASGYGQGQNLVARVILADASAGQHTLSLPPLLPGVVLTMTATAQSNDTPTQGTSEFSRCLAVGQTANPPGPNPNPPGQPGAHIAAVPTLGHAALALLGALVGGLGLRGQRRKQS